MKRIRSRFCNTDIEYVAEQENQLFKGISTLMVAANVPFDRFYVEVDNVQVWTGSSIPKEEIPTIDYDKKPPILLIHGICSNLGVWVRNITSLQSHGNPVFAIDLPGFGLSTRIDFPDDHNESEQLFCKYIHLWLIKMQLRKVVFVGHSFGGYLSCSFACNYPWQVVNIVLIDPWGIIETKNYLVDRISSEGLSALKNLLLTRFAIKGRIAKLISPFLLTDLVRVLGKIYGLSVVRTVEDKICQGFVKDLGDSGPEIWASFIYAINSLHPRYSLAHFSGELAFRSMIDPFFNAKNPIMERLERLSFLKKLYYICGEESPLDYKAGHWVKNQLDQTELFVIPNADHKLHINSYMEANEILIEIIKDINET
ncbi:Abhydrolase domain-containing protein 4 [Thelohanellus kitauei]|uniref:Abhydrolase domain-containing protein 4 n=1 Tax=Thelohanellus kitauei TaxID=669202 RepID=A0A0C2I885_THEKT|nr:Abhydrolase domain-containing protein 4 [Thelohanellus kitauei]